jgi:hypothetical protein
MTEPRVIEPVSRSVKNTSGADIAQGVIVNLKATGTSGLAEVEPATAGDLAYGVTADAIADDAIGRVQRSGVALVIANGTLTIGGECASDADGEAVDATTNARVLGQVLTNPGANELAEVDLQIGAVSP